MKFKLTAAALALSVALPAVAADLVVFNAGEAAVAADVNSNFTAVEADAVAAQAAADAAAAAAIQAQTTATDAADAAALAQTAADTAAAAAAAAAAVAEINTAKVTAAETSILANAAAANTNAGEITAAKEMVTAAETSIVAAQTTADTAQLSSDNLAMEIDQAFVDKWKWNNAYSATKTNQTNISKNSDANNTTNALLLDLIANGGVPSVEAQLAVPEYAKTQKLQDAGGIELGDISIRNFASGEYALVSNGLGYFSDFSEQSYTASDWSTQYYTGLTLNPAANTILYTNVDCTATDGTDVYMNHTSIYINGNYAIDEVSGAKKLLSNGGGNRVLVAAEADGVTGYSISSNSQLWSWDHGKVLAKSVDGVCSTDVTADDLADENIRKFKVEDISGLGLTVTHQPDAFNSAKTNVFAEFTGFVGPVVAVAK